MMKDNYKQGVWKHYDRTGRLAYEEEYQQGTVVKTQRFWWIKLKLFYMKLKNAITLSAIALATMLGTTDLYAQQKKGKKCKKTEQSCQKPNYGKPLWGKS